MRSSLACSRSSRDHRPGLNSQKGGDPERVRRAKVRIAARLRDMPRHFRALNAARARFGDDFDRDEFAAAARSDDPDRLNAVKAVERGLDLLDNYLVELVVDGLQLAGLRDAGEALNGPRDLRRLRDAGVLAQGNAERLIALVRIRARMVHEYAELDPDDVHRAVEILVAELPGFERAYIAWVKAGFPASAGD